MLYPVYVHLGDEQTAHGVTIPDLPGCFSAADSWDELPAKIQEAVELYFEGENIDIPEPTPLEKLARQPEYEGGVWMMVDIDWSRVRPKAVRLPDLAEKSRVYATPTLVREAPAPSRRVIGDFTDTEAIMRLLQLPGALTTAEKLKAAIPLRCPAGRFWPFPAIRCEAHPEGVGQFLQKERQLPPGGLDRFREVPSLADNAIKHLSC